MKQLISSLDLDTSMDRQTVTEILRIAADIDTHGYPQLEAELERSLVLGKMFYGATSQDRPICDLTAARLGLNAVDLNWANADITESTMLLDELRMASEAVDLLITTFSNHETFGDGRKLTKKFPESSVVPVISLHDDFYDWQSALSHLHGFQRTMGDLRGKQIVIVWGFGSSFSSPAAAHSLMVASTLVGANVRVSSPPEFSLLNRIRSKTREIASEEKSTFEETTEFTDSLKDADAVFSLNWLRLNDFNHPERSMEHARKYRDWYLTPQTLPDDCIFSTEPPFQPDLMFSPELVQDPRNISRAWLSRRVQVLASTIVHVLRQSNDEEVVSVV